MNIDRLQLQNMISSSSVADQTDNIRALKHSSLIRDDVQRMIELKAKHADDADALYEESTMECSFLFMHYTDIYNKLRKDELNVDILLKFVDVLRRIEEGELNQYEGSVMVGTLLKELYIDSALKKAEKLNERRVEDDAPKPRVSSKPCSWKEFKLSHT